MGCRLFGCAAVVQLSGDNRLGNDPRLYAAMVHVELLLRGVHVKMARMRSLIYMYIYIERERILSNIYIYIKREDP